MCSRRLATQRTKAKHIPCEKECQQHCYAVHDVSRAVCPFKLVQQPADVHTGLRFKVTHCISATTDGTAQQQPAISMQRDLPY